MEESDSDNIDPSINVLGNNSFSDSSDEKQDFNMEEYYINNFSSKIRTRTNSDDTIVNSKNIKNLNTIETTFFDDLFIKKILNDNINPYNSINICVSNLTDLFFYLRNERNKISKTTFINYMTNKKILNSNKENIEKIYLYITNNNYISKNEFFTYFIYSLRSYLRKT